MNKTISKLLVILACLAATCYLTQTGHRVTAFGAFCLAVAALVLMPDDEEKSTP
jgi:uncharacterized membrane protein